MCVMHKHITNFINILGIEWDIKIHCATKIIDYVFGLYQYHLLSLFLPILVRARVRVIKVALPRECRQSLHHP